MPKWRNPKVGTMVFAINDKREFIMGKRAGSSHGFGTWTLPGGFVEYWEDMKETAIRETMEEIGCKVGRPLLVDTTNEMFHAEDIHSVTLWFVAPLVDGRPRQMEPALTNIGWYSVNRMPSPLFMPFQYVDMHKVRTGINQVHRESRRRRLWGV